MASEVNMYQAQVNEYKYELERANRELMDIKKKYYENKRKEQLQREMEEEGGLGANSSSVGGVPLMSRQFIAHPKHRPRASDRSVARTVIRKFDDRAIPALALDDRRPLRPYRCLG